MSAAQITQVVTAMPTPPDTASPSTFSDRAVATAAAQADLVTELNTVITQANALSTQVNSESTSAAADAATATTKAAEATASALTAVNAPGTSATSTTSLAIQTTLPASISLTIQTGKSVQVGMNLRIAYTTSPANWMEGYITAYNSSTGALTVTVTSSQGTGTYAAWTVSLAPAALTTVTNSVQTKTGAFTAYATDIGKEFICTGTWTAGFDASATLGDGWYAWYRNTSTGTITFDPNGSETIDGGSTTTLESGDAALVTCDGTALYTVKAAPSGMRLLATITPTASAAVNFLSTFTSTYDDFLVIFNGIKPAADDSLRFRAAVGGSSDTGSNYQYGAYGGAINNNNTAVPVSDIVTAAGKGLSGRIQIENVNSAATIKSIETTGTSQSAATPTYSALKYAAAYIAASALSGGTLFWNGGSNFAAQGQILIFGFRKNY